MNEHINHPIDDDQYFCRFTFGQFFAILVIEVVALFFAFYLGARYGEKVLGFDQRYVTVGEKSVVAMTTDPEIQEMARELVGKAKTPALRDRIASMLEDAAKKQEENKPKEDMIVEEEDLTVEEPSENDYRKNEVDKLEDKIAQNETPQPGVESMSEESVVRMKSPSHARYSVQVGSFDNRKEADQKLSIWRKKGYPAYLMIADIPERGRWYRVRIGGFPTINEAEDYIKKELPGVNTLVIKNEQ